MDEANASGRTGGNWLNNDSVQTYGYDSYDKAFSYIVTADLVVEAVKSDQPVVKMCIRDRLSSAEDTWLATAWENRKMPTQIILNSSAGRACGC